ncbi:hypothetical protein E4U28_008572 [Claviceps purpurea]|nr:hypothetical protein E4U28_008572 [Claviceps purpurea]
MGPPREDEPSRPSYTDNHHHHHNERSASSSAEEARLVRKLDLHLIPLIMAIYLFSFIDRVNVGNARLYHLERDLSLTPSQFQLILSVFFIPYMLFEVPSNLVLKRRYADGPGGFVWEFTGV